MMRRHACWVVASGFSQNTGLPASIAASTYSSCVGPQEHTTTASTASSAMRSWPVECARAAGTVSATRLASSRLTSVTALTDAPARTVVSLRMWSLPIIPTPMTPTLTVTCDSFLCGGTALCRMRCRATHPASGAGWESALGGLEFVAQFGEFATAGHLGGELLEGDLVAVLVQHPLTELEDDEVVADQVGVVRVVGDEHHAQAGVPCRGGVFEHHPGLLDAQRGGRL